MKLNFVSYWNKRDEDGDLEIQFSVMPTIVYQFFGSRYGNRRLIYINWLLWEIEFDFNPVEENEIY